MLDIASSKYSMWYILKCKETCSYDWDDGSVYRFSDPLPNIIYAK